jgi:hypothetical protein
MAEYPRPQTPTIEKNLIVRYKLRVMWEKLKKPGSFRSLVAFAGSFAFSLASYVLSQWLQPARSALDRGQLPSHGLPLTAWILRFYSVLNSWPWIFVVFLVFAGLSVLKRNKANGWTYALVAGIAMVGIVRLIEHLPAIGRLDDMR